MMRAAGAAALALVTFTWCGLAAAEVLEVSGATTVQRRVLEPGAEALKNATGVQVKIHGPGTGKGMLALFDGTTLRTVPTPKAMAPHLQGYGGSMAATPAGWAVSCPRAQGIALFSLQGTWPGLVPLPEVLPISPAQDGYT